MPDTLTNNTQKYIDRLREESEAATQEWSKSVQIETKAKTEYDKKSALKGFLDDLLKMLNDTSKVGVVYSEVLLKIEKHVRKIGDNAGRGICALKWLIKEAHQITDCSEALAKLIKDLSDSIDCTIAGKDQKDSIMSIIEQLKKESEKNTLDLKLLIVSFLTTLQHQEYLEQSLVGEPSWGNRGLEYQFRAMNNQLLYGNRYGSGAHESSHCASCTPRDKKIFPMDDGNCDFYERLKKAQANEEEELKKIKITRDEAIAKRERDEAKKLSIDAALAAALAAKACEIKN